MGHPKELSPNGYGAMLIVLVMLPFVMVFMTFYVTCYDHGSSDGYDYAVAVMLMMVAMALVLSIMVSMMV